MTSSKHTPGPWFYSQESIDHDWYIVTINGGLIVANVNSHWRQVANARLVAAAPDLLEALKAVVSAWEVTGPIEAAERMDAAIHAARAAIAKAEAA